MSNRFVILFHETSRGDHWDIMLETGDTLTTWAIPPQMWAQSLPPQSFSCVGTRLPDHRVAYLDYEGPISNDRGSVHCVDRGTFCPGVAGAFRLAGEKLVGLLTVEECNGETVRIDFVAENKD